MAQSVFLFDIYGKVEVPLCSHLSLPNIWQSSFLHSSPSILSFSHTNLHNQLTINNFKNYTQGGKRFWSLSSYYCLRPDSAYKRLWRLIAKVWSYRISSGAHLITIFLNQLSIYKHGEKFLVSGVSILCPNVTSSSFFIQTKS